LTERLKKQLEFIIEIDKMKTVYRRALIIHDRSRTETDAEHSWHFAVAALLLYEYAAEDGIEIERVVRMALVHDLVEIYAGDTFAYDTRGYSDKEERERNSADKLFAILPADQAKEFRFLWEEFDAMETADSRYAAAIDRLLPFISNAMTEGYAWKRFGVTEDQVMKRMAPIESALPALWEFVAETVRDARGKGYMK